MTTPNNQTTPPPGMEILTDYTKPLPEGAKLWIPELENIAGFWDFSGNIGLKPSLGFIYAIPITVPIETHTPDNWCKITGTRIIDPDGWRFGARGFREDDWSKPKSWEEPISLEEFKARTSVSTQMLRIPTVPATGDAAERCCMATFELGNGEYVSPCHLPKGHEGNHKGTCLGSNLIWPRGFSSEEEMVLSQREGAGDATLKFLEKNGFKIIRSAQVAGDALSIAIESEFGLSLDVYPSGVHVIVIAKGPDKGVYEYEDTEDILHILKAGTGGTTNEIRQRGICCFRDCPTKGTHYLGESPDCVYHRMEEMDTTNEKGGEQQERWPKDRLKAIPHERDVSTWYIATESDGLLIGCIQCIVAESFAKGLVETWNASLDVQPVEQRQELLPCPFCGSAPRTEKIGGDDGYGYWDVSCPKCNGNDGRFCGVHGEDKEDAETKWNTRK